MTTANSAAVPQNRFDLYRPIHKALRAFMSDTLVAVGRMDADDAAEVAAAVEQTRALLGTLAVHLDDENRFVHAAMEARSPGTAGSTAEDHLAHERALAELEGLLGDLERAAGAARADAALELYRRLAVFAAENFEHMDVEERQNNAVLWANYTDEELAAIEGRIVASIPPDALFLGMRWMIPAVNHTERAGLLGAMRAGMPRDAFEAVLGIAREHLGSRDWAKLERALGLSAALAA